MNKPQIGIKNTKEVEAMKEEGIVVAIPAWPVASILMTWGSGFLGIGAYTGNWWAMGGGFLMALLGFFIGDFIVEDLQNRLNELEEG